MSTDTQCPGLICEVCEDHGDVCDRYAEAHMRLCRFDDCHRPAAPGSDYCCRCRDDVAGMAEMAMLRARRLRDAADCRTVDAVTRWALTLVVLALLWWVTDGFVSGWVR